MIAAIVLAAGLSSRMGTNKLLLPLGKTTLIERVVDVLAACRVDDIVVVTGHERGRVEAALSHCAVRFARNPAYASGEMLSSIQAGPRAMQPDCKATLIAPGDQPLVMAQAVGRVIGAYAPGRIVIPSHQKRGGHPILLDAVHWADVLAASPEMTLRDVIREKSSCVHYIQVDTSVLCDVDTPGQYQDVLEAGKSGNSRTSRGDSRTCWGDSRIAPTREVNSERSYS